MYQIRTRVRRFVQVIWILRNGGSNRRLHTRAQAQVIFSPKAVLTISHRWNSHAGFSLSLSLSRLILLSHWPELFPCGVHRVDRVFVSYITTDRLFISPSVNNAIKCASTLQRQFSRINAASLAYSWEDLSCRACQCVCVENVSRLWTTFCSDVSTLLVDKNCVCMSVCVSCGVT